MLKTNFLKSKLEKGVQTIGTWNIINSPVVADVISSCNLDFLVVDGEHGSFSYETAQNIVLACESNNVSPIMRIGEITENNILRALDIGVHGIQIPCISSCSELDKVVNFSKYPPKGKRGFSPFTRSGLYDQSNASKMTSIANKNTLLIAGIENMEGIEVLPKLLEFEDLDIVFIGLYDLSKSMGIPGQIEDKKILTILDDIIKETHNAGKKIGTIATSLEFLKLLKNKKMDYITYSVDTGMLKNVYKDLLSNFKNI